MRRGGALLVFGLRRARGLRPLSVIIASASLYGLHFPAKMEMKAHWFYVNNRMEGFVLFALTFR